MAKNSLFADQQREAKLNKLDDALRSLEEHVDFAALGTRPLSDVLSTVVI